MYYRANFGLVALLLVGVLGALALMFASGRRPSESEMRDALERELDSFVTPGAVMCGLVPKGVSRAEAINCVESSISQKSPFVAAFQEQGRRILMSGRVLLAMLTVGFNGWRWTQARLGNPKCEPNISRHPGPVPADCLPESPGCSQLRTL